MRHFLRSPLLTAAYIETDPARRHSLGRRVLFWLKSRAHIVRRSVLNLSSPKQLARAHPSQLTTFSQVISEVITPLYADTQPNERLLQLGKVQNLRVVASRLDGLYLPAGAEFSFWRQVGWPTRWAGFVEGRELRAGCIIPTVAGGICQASNSLYSAAKQAGFTITERHGHTEQVPGAAFKPGDDATVFWNYVDLRFRSNRQVLLRVILSQDNLTIRFLGEA